VAPKQNDREARQARERLRAYQARQTVHEHKVKRRKRDNWVAGIAAIVIVALAVGTQLLYFSAGPGAAKASSSSSPSTSPSAGGVPPKTLAEDRTWTGTMTINGVPLGVSLDGAAAPQAVSSTVSLVQKKFYDGLTCHRLTNGGFYVLQCGDPKGDGSGGPGYSIRDELNDRPYVRGTVGMALSGPDTGGSQFFITHSPQPHLDAKYTVFGQVVSGMEIVDRIQQLDVIQRVRIWDGKELK